MSSRNIKDRVLRILEDDGANRVVDKELTQEMQSSFLEYAMSVIKSRALPDYRDGLKPVHRRIIYAAAQEGLTHDKKYKKSAAIVGSVMGSYHPHGDAAIYDALVRMAQDFSLRYPLIQGQGNFGSIDGDAPAAMRYTEARLSELCSQFTDGLGEDWVEMVDNYDQSKKEPVVLPTLLPNLLINGSEGIAVGLATKIPPHNLSEVIDAAVALIRNPDLKVEEIKDYIKGPDFPTGGEVLNYGGVLDYFGVFPDRKQKRSFRLRGRVEIEKETGTRGRIIIKEIPYGVKKTSIITQIVSCMDSEKKRGIYVMEFDEYIKDIRDESSRDEIRVVIEYSGCKPEVILNNLYKYTRLQISFCTGLVVLINNEPKRLNILEFLDLYVKHQQDMLCRRAAYRIEVLSRRIHILEGRLIIVDDVMEAVRIITSSDEPERELQEKYGLSDEQLKDVLDLRVRRLKKMSVNEMQEEMRKKVEERQWNRDLLDSGEKQKEELIRRLAEVREKYGDQRKTVINMNERETGYISPEDTKHYEDMVFILSEKSYLSQIPLSSKFFKMAKRRRSKSFMEIEMYRGDGPKYMISCHGRDDLLFFTDRGRVYRKKAHEFGLKSGFRNKGRLIRNLIPALDKDETVVHMMRLRKEEYSNPDLFLVFVTENGMVKRTGISQFYSVLSNGKLAVRLMQRGGSSDKLKFVLKTTSDKDLFIVSSEYKSKENFNNNVVRCPVDSFRVQSRMAMGRRGIKLNLKAGQRVISASTTYEGGVFVTIDSDGRGKFTDVSEFRKTKRGNAKGVVGFQTDDPSRKCISGVLFNLDDDILMTTSEDKIYKFRVSEMGTKNKNGDGFKGLGRFAKGRKLLSRDLEENKVKVTYYSKLPADAITLEDYDELEDDFDEEDAPEE